MSIWRGALILAACAAMTGCGSDLTCDDPQRYESAQEGVRIVPPKDLDNLESSKELAVPTASPRDARPEGSPCLDRPPRIKLER